ncbi:VWA domain-containing protein [Spirillospora sp. NBC_00431]
MTYSNAGNLRYAVDIVLCIDVTDSMWPVLDAVKKSAMSFHQRLDAAMAEKGKAVSQLRLRVIAFRDFGDHAESAIEQTGFLVFPDQASEFDTFVRGLLPLGGGDVPESGLEALALAIASPWERGLDRRRHIIVMFTDAPAHPLGDPRSRAAHTYPPEVPATMDDLFERWGYASSTTATMENSAKRLVLFAPDCEPWADLVEEWNQTLLFPSAAGAGLEEFEMGEIINTIVNSL